jgi:hypothetical protein
MSQPTFFSSRGVRIAALLILFISAFAIRLYDLTDPPLDFHPTRQLLSAIKARAYFYETKPAGVSFDKVEDAKRQAKLKAQVEPEILEQVVAFTYRFTGEQVWVARIYSSLFWIIGGIFLFLLVRDLLTFDAAIFSIAYYLFFPYAVLASRSFQPDPLMVMLIVAFWWAFARWVNVSPERNAMKWSMALLAGLLGGLTILVKFTSAFFVIGAALGLALSRMSVRQLLRNGQVWVIAFFGALPGLIYLINGLFIQGGLGSQFSGRFVPALLLDPFNYLQWTVKMDMAAGGFFIMLALLGFFLTNDRHYRFLMFGLWGGYLLYSLYFNYHAATHDYYQLPFIPIVAVSLGPLGGWFFARLAEGTVQRWQRSAAYLILIAGLFMVVWNTRNQMKAMDFRPQAAMWAQIGKLTEGRSAVGLVGDYGSPLEYYGWKTVPVWPYTGDTKYARGGVLPTEKLFEEYSSKRDYFIVTDFEELDRQPALKKLLMKYPVLASGNGFVIYNLEK